VHIASGDAWGGAERVLLLLAHGLLERPDVRLEALLFNEGRLADALRALGVRVHVIPEGRHSLPGLVRATRRWLAQAQPDVVHAHRYKEMLAAALARAPRRRGLVVTVHGLEPRQQLTRLQLLRVWGALISARLAGARFVTVSNELARRLRRTLGPGAVTRISNPMPSVQPAAGAADLRHRLGWSASRPLVGFVGRLEHVKGPDRFLQLATHHGGDAGFVLVGGGSMEHALREHVAVQGLSDRVALIGEVPDATDYLPQFDVLAVPSRHEGFPMILLEAAACEVPVVAFDVGGVREVLDGAPLTWLTQADDMRRFDEAVRDLLAHPGPARTAAARWAAAVRARSSRGAVTRAYTAVYRAAVAGEKLDGR
jgi:glycosyltransferase involved in cell wall biosynthesis